MYLWRLSVQIHLNFSHQNFSVDDSYFAFNRYIVGCSELCSRCCSTTKSRTVCTLQFLQKKSPQKFKKVYSIELEVVINYIDYRQ